MTLNTIYIYIIPPITIALALIVFYAFGKILQSDKTLDEHLKQVREKEADEFDEFVRAIQNQKKELEANCVSEKLSLQTEKLKLATDLKKFYKEVRETLDDTIKELQETQENYTKRIKNLEDENIKYKKTCKSKFAQVQRLKEEIATLKQKLNEVTTG